MTTSHPAWAPVREGSPASSFIGTRRADAALDGTGAHLERNLVDESREVNQVPHD